ncbi:uncharacterized protein LOC130630686 [Hydractinia symbiolongicarpus]|uniref:uncharacterized protein LOC130630686 n=1 Tax=Hydractinia symbiolongicarpus TaxID=13093 RepID=UPI00254A6D2D|nr:uncharacterized protein LOC130630686 [Hydractinia symbiolongicarpus]
MHFHCMQPPSDVTGRLPRYWNQNMAPADRHWVAKHLFCGTGTLATPVRLWNYPPAVNFAIASKPKPESYFLRRIYLWMPRRMFTFDFKCCKESCNRSLKSNGIYNKIRLVLDVTEYYYLATEYLICSCGFTVLAWDNRILNQLPYGIRVKFPALLTYKYACDSKVISLLKSRTLGNSPTALHNTLVELHSESWIRKNVQYLFDCQKHRKRLAFHQNQIPSYDVADSFRVLPQSKWFLAAFARDVWSRMDSVKAAITSVFGVVLKIDSTKKILKKLSGEAKGSASWVTNVGNEYGAILQSVVTSSESNESLKKMADGIVDRYAKANVTPPIILYTDRDCCCYNGPSKFNVLFSAWPNLTVKLDIWHFMRRISFGCTSESHPLYGVFMAKLSGN